MADVLHSVDTFQKVDELMRVCRSAVRKAQAESRDLGVANVYSFEGQLYYELPSGEFSRERPCSGKLPGSSSSRNSCRDRNDD